MSQAQPVIEFIPCQCSYRVTLKEDGLEMTGHVRSKEQIDAEVDYLRKRIADECRDAFLRNRDDI